jgi:hypothetical protein
MNNFVIWAKSFSFSLYYLKRSIVVYVTIEIVQAGGKDESNGKVICLPFLTAFRIS